MTRVALSRKPPPHPRRGCPVACRSSDTEMPHLAPDAAHPVARRSGSGSVVATVSTADTSAAAGTAPTIAASTLAVVVAPGESAALGTSLPRSTSLTLHLEWRQEVALRQLGPDGQCRREVGVAVNGPVGFQGVRLVDERHRELGLLQICRSIAGKDGRETFEVGPGGCTDCAYAYTTSIFPPILPEPHVPCGGMLPWYSMRCCMSSRTASGTVSTAVVFCGGEHVGRLARLAVCSVNE